MKTLYLMRHAKSSWEDHSLRDIQRPLNKRGHRDAPFMGRQLKSKGIFPQMIITSPALRALSTASYVAREINYPLSKINTNKRLYEADEEEILQVIKEVDPSIDHLLIVGHNPGLTDLANRVSTDPIDNIVTAGIYSVQFDCLKWKDIGKSKARFHFYIYPKMFS